MLPIKNTGGHQPWPQLRNLPHG